MWRECLRALGASHSLPASPVKPGFNLHRRKLRLREAQQHTLGHTASRWQSLDWDPGLSDSSLLSPQSSINAYTWQYGITCRKRNNHTQIILRIYWLPVWKMPLANIYLKFCTGAEYKTPIYKYLPLSSLLSVSNATIRPDLWRHFLAMGYAEKFEPGSRKSEVCSFQGKLIKMQSKLFGNNTEMVFDVWCLSRWKQAHLPSASMETTSFCLIFILDF